MNEAYLLLGSNLGNRKTNIDKAVEKIKEQAGVIITTSSIYETEPWGTDAPLSFYNQVIIIKTLLSAERLLDILLKIEKEIGRLRTEIKNEPRIIDLDILFYNKEIIKRQNLEIPHPRLHLRRFVLVPLYEIAPLFFHPLLAKSISELLNECGDDSWVKKL